MDNSTAQINLQTITSVSASEKAATTQNNVIKRTGFFSRVPIVDIVLSIKQLSVMLKSSLALEDAIKALSDQTINKTLKKAYTEILHDIQSGKTLAEGMSYYKFFPQVLVSIIRAGEQGGSLEKNLIYLADYLKKAYELQKKVKGALFYPMFILSFTVIEMLAVFLLIIPKLEDMFTGFDKIPTFTKVIMAISKFLIHYKFILLVVVIIVITGAILFSRSKTGKILWDKVGLRMPIIKILIKHSILANFSRTLNILLDSGIPIVTALEIAAETVGSPSYKKVLHQVHSEVKTGHTLAESLSKHSRFFPPTFTKLVEIGEQTASLEDDLMYLNEFYSQDVEDLTSNMTTLLEPILLVFIGLMTGLLAISIVLPIYQLTGSIES